MANTQPPVLRHINNFFNTLDRKLDKDLRSHLKNVYGTLALSILAAAAGAYVHVFTDILQGNFLVVIASIVSLMALFSTPHSKENETKRFAYLMIFAAASGLSTGPLLDFALMIEPSIIVTAFMATCTIFACFTLAALYAPDRKFLYLGGMLMSTLSTLFWLGLANIFFRSQMIFQANLYIGLFVMMGFVLYDTQLIVEKRRRGDDDYIWHSVDLFIDFIGIFRRLLILLSQREAQRDNRKRRD